jgi:hypothetical protein
MHGGGGGGFSGGHHHGGGGGFGGQHHHHHDSGSDNYVTGRSPRPMSSGRLKAQGVIFALIAFAAVIIVLILR